MMVIYSLHTPHTLLLIHCISIPAEVINFSSIICSVGFVRLYIMSFNHTQLSFMDMTEKVIFITNYPEEILFFTISNEKYTISVRIGLNRGSKTSAFKKQMRIDYCRFHTSCERYFSQFYDI